MGVDKVRLVSADLLEDQFTDPLGDTDRLRVVLDELLHDQLFFLRKADANLLRLFRNVSSNHFCRELTETVIQPDAAGLVSVQLEFSQN